MPSISKSLRTFALVCNRAALSLFLTLSVSQAGTVAAQAGDDYPSKKPIKFLVPFGTGGAADITARLVARALESGLKQSVYVENRAGANGVIGTEVGARSEPDGYTVLLGSIGTHVANQYLYGKLPYDPLKDFIPVTMLMTADNVVTVSTSSSINSLRDLIDHAKGNPGKLNYGIPAIGDSAHLSVEKFRRDAGIDVVGVPYKSVPAASIDLIGGRIDFMFSAITGQVGNISSGKVRALATTGPVRSRILPNVPTVAESGFPNFAGVVWLGLFVPAKTPATVVNKLFATVKNGYEAPELQRTMEASGSVLVASSSPEEFADFIAKERVKWLKVIQESNIKLD